MLASVLSGNGRVARKEFLIINFSTGEFSFGNKMVDVYVVPRGKPHFHANNNNYVKESWACVLSFIRADK